MVHIRSPWIFQDMMDELDRWSRDPSWAFGGREAPDTGGLDVNDGTATLELELPGVEDSDLDIVLEDNRLRVLAKRSDLAGDREDVLLRERTYGEFSREYRLPWPVDEASAVARLEHGVLHLDMKRAPEAEPRRIEVRSA